MNLTLDENRAEYHIFSYAPGKVQVNEQFFTNSIIIAPDQLIENWQPQNFNELKREHLLQVLPLKPDVLLIGTGAVQQFPPLALYGDLLNQGIGVEVMDSAAACRTFNILTAEDRRVVLALLI